MLGVIYEDIIRVCTHHDFDNCMLVYFFYESMSSYMKQFLKVIYDGNFMNKSLEETLQFLD